MGPASGVPGRLEQSHLALRHTESSVGLTQLLWPPLQQHLDKQNSAGGSCSLNSCPNQGLCAQRRLGTASSPGLCPRLGKEAEAGFVCASAQQNPTLGGDPLCDCGLWGV